MWFANRALRTAARRTDGGTHVCWELATFINIHVFHTILLSVRGFATVDYPANNVFLVYKNVRKEVAIRV